MKIYESWKEISLTRKLVIICVAVVTFQVFILIQHGSELTVIAIDVFTLMKPELFLWLTIPPAIFLFLIIILIVDGNTSIRNKLIIICIAVIAVEIFTLIKFFSELAILVTCLSTIFMFLIIILIVNAEKYKD
jgi:hypothetical protein